MYGCRSDVVMPSTVDPKFKFASQVAVGVRASTGTDAAVPPSGDRDGVPRLCRGCGGPLKGSLGITIKVALRPKDADGFVVLPKKWVVERSNSRTMRARRSARDHERLMSHAEGHIQWVSITLMSRRLARRHRRTEVPRLSLPIRSCLSVTA